MLSLKPLASAMIVMLRVVPEVPAHGGSGMPIAKVRTPPPTATADTTMIIARVLFGNRWLSRLSTEMFQFARRGFVANRVLAIMQNEVMLSQFVIVFLEIIARIEPG